MPASWPLLCTGAKGSNISGLRHLHGPGALDLLLLSSFPAGFRRPTQEKALLGPSSSTCGKKDSGPLRPGLPGAPAGPSRSRPHSGARTHAWGSLTRSAAPQMGPAAPGCCLQGVVTETSLAGRLSRCLRLQSFQGGARLDKGLGVVVQVRCPRLLERH